MLAKFLCLLLLSNFAFGNEQTLKVFPPGLTVITGELRQLLVQKRNGRDLLGVNKQAQFQSLSPQIISVNERGEVRGANIPGTAIIRVTVGDLSIDYPVTNLGVGRYIYFKKPTDWGQLNFYAWQDVGGEVIELAGSWPGEVAEPAIELGGTWYRYFVGRDSLDSSQNFKLIFNNGGYGSQTDDFSMARTGLPYFDLNGSYGRVPIPGPALDGTQIQVQGGSINLSGSRSNLSGKLFLPGQLLDLGADQPGPGRRFVRWEGAGAPYLLDDESPSSLFVVGPGASLTVFAIFDIIDDPFEDARSDFKRLCSGCHGDDGNGRPSLRNLSSRYDLDEITAFIDGQMPKYQASLCTGDCASGIGAMILAEAFEAPEGRCEADSLTSMLPVERNIRLLTRVEYGNTIEDLLGLDVRSLIREKLPEDFVVNHFQTDSSSVYTRQHAFSYFKLSQELASLAPKEDVLAPTCGGDSSCLVSTFGLNAFRRPLTYIEKEKYRSLYEKYGYEAMLQAFLSSPQTLYRSELGEPQATDENPYYQLSDYEVASLLSYTFWKSMPDAVALEKARKNQLSSPEEIADEARRLLQSPKARAAFRLFWEGLFKLRKSIGADIPVAMKSHMKEEMVRFAEYIVFDKQGRFEDLMLSQESFVNQDLANYYGLPFSGEGWQKVRFEDGDRVGVMGKAHFLASNSTTIATHPIKRGLFVREMLLCQDFPPPPIGAELKPVKNPSFTTREKFEKSHRQESCLSCHQFIDGIGFGLESYDQFGKLRDMERVPNGEWKPIDASGGIGSLNSAETVLSANEPVEPFTGIRELSQLINDSKNGRACFARQFYRYSVGERVATDQSCTLRVFGEEFRGNRQSILDLMVSFTQTINYTLRR